MVEHLKDTVTLAPSQHEIMLHIIKLYRQEKKRKRRRDKAIAVMTPHPSDRRRRVLAKAEKEAEDVNSSGS